MPKFSALIMGDHPRLKNLRPSWLAKKCAEDKVDYCILKSETFHCIFDDGMHYAENVSAFYGRDGRPLPHHGRPSVTRLKKRLAKIPAFQGMTIMIDRDKGPTSFKVPGGRSKSRVKKARR